MSRRTGIAGRSTHPPRPDATASVAPIRAAVPGCPLSATGRVDGRQDSPWASLLVTLVLTVAAVAALVGPPLQASLWSPTMLVARFADRRLPGDGPAAVAGGTLPRPRATRSPIDPGPAPKPTAPGTGRRAGAAPRPAFIWPTPGWVTQEFGCTDFSLEPWNAAADCRFHYGIDIGNQPETPVLAVKAGTVVFAGWRDDDGYGFRVLLDHGNGERSLYAHLCCPPSVRAGQQVSQGEIVGLMGSTGASSGSHLHLALEIDGQAVDPRRHLSGDPLTPDEAAHG